MCSMALALLVICGKDSVPGARHPSVPPACAMGGTEATWWLKRQADRLVRLVGIEGMNHPL